MAFRSTISGQLKKKQNIVLLLMTYIIIAFYGQIYPDHLSEASPSAVIYLS